MIERILNTTLFGVIFFSLHAAVYLQSPTKVEGDMLAALDRISNFGSYSGNNYDEAKNDKANNDLRSLLLRHGKRQDILKYAFAKLKKEMHVTTSKDGKFRIYSWDLQIGGTMHDYDCIFQYQGASGKVQVRACRSGNEYDPGSFYSRIFQIQSKNGPIYLANSTFIAEGSTHGQAIEAFRIVGETLETKPKLIKTGRGLTNLISFAYSPFTIEGESEDELVSFDAASSSFHFPVVIDDGVSGGGRVTKRFITYKFNGKHFVKVS